MSRDGRWASGFVGLLLARDVRSGVEWGPPVVIHSSFWMTARRAWRVELRNFRWGFWVSGDVVEECL
jgi:hypothetical protein